MASKNRSSKPPETAEPASAEAKAAVTDAEWPRLLARLIEGVISTELHEFEDNVMAFLDSAVEDGYRAFIRVCARVVGALFLLTGLMLFLGIFLKWWQAFALVGVVIIALGSLAGLGRRSRKRRSRR